MDNGNDVLSVLHSNIEKDPANKVQGSEPEQIKPISPTQSPTLGAMSAVDYAKQNNPVKQRKNKLPSLNADEEAAREEGSVQYDANVVRVDDKPQVNADETLTSTKDLYEDMLGVSKYSALRDRLNLRADESYTDYYKRTGYVPKGFEMEAKMLLAEEKRKKLYAEVLAGDRSETDFLYEAYGKDLLKLENHNLDSSLYWYQRRKQGYTDSILDNTTYMSSVLDQARKYWQAEEWFETSQSIKMNDLMASFVTDEVLDATTLRSYFEKAGNNTFDLLDDYYKSEQEIIKLYRAGYIQGFNPLIDINSDNKYDYYYHTDGKLYAIDGSSGKGSKKAYAHYNDDGSLNRVSLIDGLGGEVLHSTVQGFTGFFTGVIDFGATLLGGVCDLFEGLTGNGWDFSQTTNLSAEWKQFINQESYVFGNDGYIADSGFTTDDGKFNTASVLRGVGGAVGTIAAMAATMGLGNLAKVPQGATSGLRYSADLTLKQAASMGGKQVAKTVASKTALLPVKFMQTMTGISNGGVMFTRASTSAMLHTVESASILAVKDFLQTGVSLYSNKEQLGLDDAGIAGRALGVSALNWFISMALRSTDDIGAIQRWQSVFAKKEAAKKSAEAAVSNSFKELIHKTWGTKQLRTMTVANTIMDMVENMSTAYFQSTMASTGKLSTTESFMSTFSDPQFLATQLWSAWTSVRGTGFHTKDGWMKSENINEGSATGSVISKIGSLVDVYERGITELRATLDSAEMMKPENKDRRDAITKVIDNLTTFKKKDANGKEITANSTELSATELSIQYSDKLVELHNLLSDSNGNSIIIDTISEQVKKAIKNTITTETAMIVSQYNSRVAAKEEFYKKIISGDANFIEKLRPGNKDAAIYKMYEKLLKSKGVDIDKINRSNFIFTNVYSKGYTSGDELKNILINDVAPKINIKDDGSLEFINSFAKYTPEDMEDIKRAIETGVLTKQAVADGFIIEVNNPGTSVQADPKYQTLQQAVQFYKTIIDYQLDSDTTGQRFVYKLGNDAIFVPGTGMPGLDFKTRYDFLETIHAIYGIKFGTIEQRMEALKDLQRINNDGTLDNLPDKLKAFNLIKLLYNESTAESKALLSLDEAARLYDSLEEKDKPTFNNKNEKPKFVVYSDTVKSWNKVSEAYQRLVTENSEKNLEDFKKAYSDLTSILKDNKEMENYLNKYGVVDKKTLHTLNETIVNFPKGQVLKTVSERIFQGEDYNNLSKEDKVLYDSVIKVITSLSLNSEELEKVKLPGITAYTLNGFKLDKKSSEYKQHKEFLTAFLKPDRLSTDSLSSKKKFRKAVEEFIKANSKKFNSIVVNDVVRLYDDKFFSKNLQQEYKKYLLSSTPYTDLILMEAKAKLLKDPTSSMKIEEELLRPENEKLLTDLVKKYSSKTISSTEDMLRKNATFINDLHKGTIALPGSNIIHVNFAELVGAYHSKAIQRLGDNLTTVNFTKDSSVEDKIRSIYGEENVNHVIHKLEVEQRTMMEIRKDYPDGYATFDPSNPRQLKELTKILNKLNYNIVSLYEGDDFTIPGVLLKRTSDLALSFDVERAEDLLRALVNKGMESLYKEGTISEEVKADVISQLDNSLGGLTLIQDDDIVNPNKIIWCSLSNINRRNTLMNNYSELPDALDKQGKLASKVKSLLALGHTGYGLASETDPELKQFEIILSCIDSIAELYEDKNNFAISKIILTKEQYDDFIKSENGLWKLEESNDTSIIKEPSDRKVYIVTPREDLDSKTFKEKALEILSRDVSNLNYIIPCYNCGISEDGSSVISLLGQYILNFQNTLGTSPITKAIESNIAFYQPEQIFDLFCREDFSHKGFTFNEKEALDYFKGKTVKELLGTEYTGKNIFIVSMLRGLQASKDLSDSIVESITKEGLNNLLPILGNKSARKELGALLFGLTPDISNEEVLTRIKTSKILQNIDNQTIITKGSRRSYNDTIEESGFSGADAAEFNIASTNKVKAAIDLLTVDDIQVLRDMLTFTHRTVSTYTSLEPNAYLKLLSILESGLTGEGKVNLFIDSLTEFTKKELNDIVLPTMKNFLSKKDYNILEEKVNLLESNSNLFVEDIRTSPQSTVLEQTGLGNAASAISTNNAITREGGDNTAFEKAMQYAIASANKNYILKKAYKLSDIETLSDSKALGLMKGIASLLESRVLPNVDRKASMLIQNFNIADYQGELINSLFNLSKSLSTIIKQSDATSNLPPEAAIDLALQMYLYSSNVDFQSEWTKYIIVDTHSGKIVNTAQHISQGYKTLNDFLMQVNKTLDTPLDPANPTKLIAFSMEKNMLLHDPTGESTLKYVPITTESERAMLRYAYIQNGIRQFESPMFNKTNFTGGDNASLLEKANFVYAHTLTTKSYSDAIVDMMLEAGIDSQTARSAVELSLWDLQSSKSTNSNAEQLLTNTISLLEKGMTETDRLKFNLHQKRINEALVYNLTYEGLPAALKKSIANQAKGMPEGIKDITNMLLSNNKEKLDIAIREFKKNNPNLSDKEIFNYILKDYLYNSNEASALSSLLLGYIDREASSKIPKIQIEIGETNKVITTLQDILDKDKRFLDLEAFYEGKVTEPFQVTVLHEIANPRGEKEYISETVYRPVFYVDKEGHRKLVESIKDVEENFPTYFKEYNIGDTSSGARQAVDKYLAYIKSLTPEQKDPNRYNPKTFKNELRTVLGADDTIPLIGFNNKGYDNQRLIELGFDKSIFEYSVDAMEILNSNFSRELASTNKRQLETLIKVFGLEDSLKKFLHDKLGITSGSHDAAADTAATLLLLEELQRNNIDINSFRTDTITDIETIATSLLGRDIKIDNLIEEGFLKKVEGSDNIDLASLKLKDTNLTAEELSFIKNYKNHYDTDNGEIKNKILNKFRALYLQREREVNMKNYWKTYNKRYSESKKTFVSYIQNKTNFQTFQKTLSYIGTKLNTHSYEETIKGISNLLVNKLKLDHVNYEKRLLEFLTYEPEVILNKLFGEFNAEEFNAHQVSDIITTKFNESNLEQTIKEHSNKKEAIYQSNAVYKRDKSNENFNNDILNELTLTDDGKLLADYLLRELNTYLLDNDADFSNIDNIQLKPMSKRREIVLDNLTEDLKEIISNQPLNKTTFERLYRMAQTADTVTLASTGKPTSVRSDTFYMNEITFKLLFGTSYNVMSEYFEAKDGCLYLPVLRQPGDKVDAVHFYRIELIKGNKQNVVMSANNYFALHGGDFDGDHNIIIRPNKAMQKFAEETFAYTKASWQVYDSLKEKLSKDLRMPEESFKNTVKNANIAIRNKATNIFSTEDLEKTLEALSEGTLSYKEALDSAIKRIRESDLFIETYPDITDEDTLNKIAKDWADYIWIKQGPDISRLGISNKGGLPYYSLSVNAAGIESNRQALRNITQSKVLKRDVASAADIQSGVFQKSLSQYGEIEHDLQRMLTYAPFNLTAYDLDSLDDLILRDIDTVRNSLSESLSVVENLLTEKELTILKKRVSNIKDSGDIVVALRLLEEYIHNTDSYVDTIATSLKGLKDYYTSSTAQAYDTYDRALTLYLKNRTNNDFSLIDSLQDISQKASLLLEHDINGDYTAPPAGSSKDRLHILDAISHHKNFNSKPTSNIVNIDSYNNKVEGNILVVLKNNSNEKYKIPHLEENSALLGPAAKDIKYSLVFGIKLDEVTSKIKPGTILKKGQKIASNFTVSPEYDGYEIIGTNEDTLLITKPYQVTGASKLVIAGTSAFKDTISNVASEENFPNGLIEDVTLITRGSDFKLNKISPELQARLKWTYYDENGNEVPEEQAYYAKVHTEDLTIVEHGDTWNRDTSDSMVDAVLIGTNHRSLEAFSILGTHSLHLDDAGNIYYDSTEAAKLERIRNSYNKPRHEHNNGVYIYKVLLYKTLLKLDSSLSTKDIIDATKKFATNKVSAGVYGTIDIARLLSKYTDEELQSAIKNLNPTEQALFSEDLLQILFPTDLTSVSENNIQQGSKKSYQAVLRKSKEVASSAPYKAEGTLADTESGRFHLGGDEYISLIDLKNIINSNVADIKSTIDNTKQYSRAQVSYDEVEDWSQQELVYRDAGLRGTNSEGYKPQSTRFTGVLNAPKKPSINTKTGTEVDLNMKQVLGRQHIVDMELGKPISIPSKDFNLEIPINYHTKLNPNSKFYTKVPSVDVVRKVETLLEGSLIPEKDNLSKASRMFDHDIVNNLSVNMHQTSPVPSGNSVMFKYNPITSTRLMSTLDYYNSIMENFSSTDYHSTVNSNYLDLESTTKKNQSKYLEDIKPEFKYLSENSIHSAPEFAVPEFFKSIQTNSYMPKEYYEGRTDYLTHVYKTDGLESGNIKIDSEEAMKAERIAASIRKEPEAVKLQYAMQLQELHKQVMKTGTLESFNEVTYILGTLDRVEALRKLKDAEHTKSKQATYDELITKLLSDLPYSEEEANARVDRFYKVYPEVMSSYRNLMLTVISAANHISGLTLEPTTSNPFFLITPTIRETTITDKKKFSSSQASVKFATSMMLDTRAYVTPNETYSNGKVTKTSLPAYAGYNFFQAMPETLNQISKQIACYNIGRRLKQEGFMENATIQEEVNTFLSGPEGKNYMEQLRHAKFTDDNAVYSFERLIYALTLDLGEGLNLQYKFLGKKPNELADAHIELFTTLQNKAKESRVSYSEALSKYREYKDTDPTLANQYLTAIKCYEYSNDVLAILFNKTPEGKKHLANFGKDLFEKTKGKTLVDSYGRKITKDVTDYRKLSDTSLESVQGILKYYLGTDENFYTQIALDAINGDVFYMSESLADNLHQTFFTSKQPSNIKKILIKMNNIAIKLLMSSPFKLLDRVVKFTGFDLATLSMADSGTILKSSRAKNELSALWNSKGSILNITEESGEYKYKELREFLYSQGLDPNNTDLTTFINGSEEYNSSGRILGSYFDATNKAFTYQTLWQRYAFWLSCKEKLESDNKVATYGSAYSKKDYIDAMTDITDENGEVKVSKAGAQAAFIMAQNIGAPGDFPALAKKLNGYTAFTTFPLALIRWGKGEATSLCTAFKNMFVEGERTSALAHLATSGMGILGIYLAQQLIIELLSSLYDVPEEQEEEWKEEQAVPNVFQTMLQGTPIMDTYSSINPLKELGDMTVNPFIKSATDDKEDTNFGTALLEFFNTNVISHVNPIVKSVGESAIGIDVIGDKMIPNNAEYTMWENLLRKAGSYLIGSAGANAIAKYAKSDLKSKSLGEGINRAINAELGNTKAYKTNQKNYYKAFSLVNDYLYADSQVNKPWSGKDTYDSIRDSIQNILNNKGNLSDIYALVDKYVSQGVEWSIIKSAVNNCSLRYKVSEKVDFTKFMSTLSSKDQECIQTAITYEDYMFPWLDDLAEALYDRYGEAYTGSSYNDNYLPRLYNNFYMRDYETNINDINIPRNYNNYNKQTYLRNYGNSSNYYDPTSTYNYMMNQWKYGKATDIWGNKQTGYTNIKGDTWTWDGGK